MSKRKLRCTGYRQLPSAIPTSNPEIQLVFNRELTPLEASGIVQIVNEALAND